MKKQKFKKKIQTRRKRGTGGGTPRIPPQKNHEKEIAKNEYPEYKAVGMGYIRFAKEEKQLFKYLLMNEGMRQSGMESESFNESVSMIMKNYGLYRDEASRLHAQMWIFVHGIASMFATDYVNWDWETVNSLVSDAYKGFMKNLQGENK